MSIAMASAEEVSKYSKKTESTSIGGDLVQEDKADLKAENEEAAIFKVTVPTIIFQAVMVVTTLYYGMLFSNWGDAVIGGENDSYYGSP